MSLEKAERVGTGTGTFSGVMEVAELRGTELCSRRGIRPGTKKLAG